MWVLLDIAAMCSFPRERIAKEVMGCRVEAVWGRGEVG